MIKYIEQLLQGQPVEWKPLGEVAAFKRGAVITKKTADEGVYPVVSGGQRPAYYVNQFNREGETITIAGSGAYAGYVMYWNEPIFVGDAFSIKAYEGEALPRYIYHFLLNMQGNLHNMKSGSGVPHVYPKDVAKVIIPIPPLSVQAEIVRILDSFTSLTAELEAELEARRAQYAHYRDELLKFTNRGGGGKIVYRPLGEIGVFMRGSGLQKKDLRSSGVPAIHYGQIYTYYRRCAYAAKSFVDVEYARRARRAKPGDLVIATTSENDDDVCKAVVWLGEGELVVGSDACFYTHCVNSKYMAYFFDSGSFYEQKKKYITGTKVRRVHIDNLAKIVIPIPPLEEQERIVRLLDEFDTLTSSLTEGLPCEIELRRQQYAYYRDQLLSFPREADLS